MTKATATVKKGTARTAKADAAAAPVKSTNGKGKAALADVAVEEEEQDDEEDVDEDDETDASESDEDADVSQRGLARLMEALGEDGLTELDRAHLGLVTGELDVDEDEDEEDDDDEEEEEEEEEEEMDDEDDEDDEEEDEEDEEEDAHDSASAPDSLAASIARSGLVQEQEDDDEDEEEDDEEDDEAQAIPMESLSDAALAALPESVRARRIYREKINNEEGLLRIRQAIAPKGLPWVETLTVSYPTSIQEELGDTPDASEDDLKRELAFYKQALHTAIQGRQLARQANLAFTRPADFFAEMVKSDEHMERVRQRLLDERAGLKASEDARKQRELKKFGKKVQVERQLERQRDKRQFEDKVKGLKRKRNGGLDGAEDGDDGDDFDIRLESALEDRPRSSSDRGRGRGRGRGAPKMRRDARDAKFGFGGKKRHAKENTRESTNDFGAGRSSFSGARGGRGASRGGGRGGRGGRGGSRGGSARGSAPRPGKSKRVGGRS